MVSPETDSGKTNQAEVAFPSFLWYWGLSVDLALGSQVSSDFPATHASSPAHLQARARALQLCSALPYLPLSSGMGEGWCAPFLRPEAWHTSACSSKVRKESAWTRGRVSRQLVMFLCLLSF